MKIKTLFDQLKSRNEMNLVFMRDQCSLEFVFDEMDSHQFKCYREFMNYIRKEYVSCYISECVLCDGQPCVDGSVLFSFISCGTKHTIEVYLRGE